MRRISDLAWRGLRGSNGNLVTVILGGAAHPLPMGREHVNHSPTGFEWGYEGSGPAQLAFAILLSATHKPALARRFYQAFKREHIATMQSNDWRIDGSVVERWLREKGAFDPPKKVDSTGRGQVNG